MKQPVTLRWSPRFHGVIVASRIAITGRRVVMVCLKANERDLRERILKHNGGCWPIGLTVRAI